MAGREPWGEHVREAFFEVCKDAKPVEGWYVSLMVRVPYYGGPEEGGWWGNDTRLLAYAYFATSEQAEAARLAVEMRAAEMTEEAQRAYGEQCLREMEWLEARGLDAHYLPEPDGAEEYFVVVTAGIPEESFGPREYS